MISYEAAMGLSVAAVVLETHSLSTRAIVASQAPHFFDWGIFRTGVVPFVIFWIAATAELNRPPFDLVEGEQELVAGFNTEYSSIRFALFYLAEFMNTITMSAIMVTLFLGGPDGPGFHFWRWLWPILWFGGKTFVFLYIYIWIRAALPRLRYDQLMDVGWKRLIPVSLGWLLIIAGALISPAWGFGLFGGCVVAGAVLYRALNVASRRRLLEAERGGRGRVAQLGASFQMRGLAPVAGEGVVFATDRGLPEMSAADGGLPAGGDGE
jgi:NADH-quinone oxidoreductase subunit H